MATKNLGQVSALYIGSTPPTNIRQIWYDDTPSQRCHKVYDTNKAQWVIIDQKIVSRITYSEITGLASRVGLAIGKYYAITDKGNVLALAITSTKVQYTDVSGNIIVDDLGVNRKYHVTSSNLLVDDVEGVFDETSRKLIFRFVDTEVPSPEDYLLAKGQKSGSYKLLKYRLSRILSQDAGNSLSWRNGLYFSIKEAITNATDRKGGLVSWDTYTKEIQKQTKTLETIAKNSQNLPSRIDEKISEATSSGRIFNKTLQEDPITYPSPVDVRRGDTLNMIIGKYNSWLKSFKTAKGIAIGADYTDATAAQYVNTNDSVQSAIGKIMYWIRNISDYLKTSPNFKAKVKDPNRPISDIEVKPNEDFNTAVEKLQGQLKLLGIVDDGKLDRSKEIEGSKYTTSFDLIRGIIRSKIVDYGEGAIEHPEVIDWGLFADLNYPAWPRVKRKGILSQIISDYFNHSTITSSKSYQEKNQQAEIRTSVVTADGMYSTGSSVVHYFLRSGLFDKYTESHNMGMVAASVIGVFNKYYARTGQDNVPTNPSADNRDYFARGNSTLYAGVYGTVDLQSVDDSGAGGANNRPMNLNRLWFGGVFDRLMARGLVLGYAQDNDIDITRERYIYRLYKEGEAYYIGHFESFILIDNRDSLASPNSTDKNLVLPISPVAGQIIKVFVESTVTNSSKTVRIKPHPEGNPSSHRKFYSQKTGENNEFILLAPFKLYEFVYTSSGWICFSSDQYFRKN
nr:MAG TPA: hypothetical protein [Caudoviricetes sp.]